MNRLQRVAVAIARWLLRITRGDAYYRVTSVRAEWLALVRAGTVRRDKWREVAEQAQATARMLSEQVDQLRTDLEHARMSVKGEAHADAN